MDAVWSSTLAQGGTVSSSVRYIKAFQAVKLVFNRILPCPRGDRSVEEARVGLPAMWLSTQLT